MEKRAVLPARDEPDEEATGVPASRGHHIALGLFCTVFGGIFGGMPLTFLVVMFLSYTSIAELIGVSLFLSIFILIGVPIFLFGLACLVSGIINYPLITNYPEEDNGDEEPATDSTAFSYVDEDDLLKQIHGEASSDSQRQSNDEEIDDDATPSSSSPSDQGGFWNIGAE